MRPIRTLLLAVIAGVVAAGISYVAYFRPRIKSWGFDEVEAEKQFPGDELEPCVLETGPGLLEVLGRHAAHRFDQCTSPLERTVSNL